MKLPKFIAPRRQSQPEKKFGQWRRALAIVAVLALVAAGPGAYLLLHHPTTAQAAWFDTRWGFREAVTLTVTSSGSDLTNQITHLTVNTSTLISAGKLQTACQDLRFLSSTGINLPYYVDNGCNTTATKIWVQTDLIPKNTTTFKIWMYYGNANASAGSSSTNFGNVIGLIDYWTFNDASGTLVANSVDYNDTGTWAGTVSSQWTTGQVGGAGTFNGTDYVTTSGKTGNTGGDITLALWIKPTNFAGPQTPVHKDAIYSFEIDTSGNVYWADSSNFSYANFGATSIGLVTGSWQYLVFTKTGGVVNIYLNGVLKATKPFGSAIGTNTNPLLLGCYGISSCSQPYTGGLDDVKIYNYARSQAQITAEYSASPAVNYLSPTATFATEEIGTAPLAYWKFDEGSGTTANNSGWGGATFAGTLNSFSAPPTATSGWQTEDQCLSGKCLRFNGSTNYVSSSGNLGITSQISISSWFSLNSLSQTNNYQMIYTGGNAGGNGYLAVVTNGIMSPIFSLTIGGTQRQLVATGISPTLGTWYHVVGTYDGTTMSIYVNGKLINSAAYSGALSDFSTGTATVGKWISAGYEFNGKIDDLKIYNYARSAAQVKTDFNQFANKAGALPQSPLSNGLVGYWKFDEGTGSSATDWSGSGNTGTWNGTLGSQWINGKFGTAGVFNGTNNYVNNGTSTTAEPTTITLSAWIKTTSAGTTSTANTIFDKTRGASNGSAYLFDVGGDIGVGHAGKLEFAMFNGSAWTAVYSNLSVNDGIWHHVVATYDLQNMKLYVDGKLDNTLATTMAIPYNGTQSLYIGAYNNAGTCFYNGSIDEARVYKRAMTSAEVTQLYNFAPGPAAYWKFDDKTGSSVSDISGNVFTGTWAGTLGNQWANGKFGGAGFFNGSDNYVTTSSSPMLFGSYTVSMWLNETSLNLAGNEALSFYSGGNDGMLMEINDGVNNKVRFLHRMPFGNSGGDSFYSSAILSLNQWYYVTLTRDDATKKMSIYVNGNLDSSITGTNAGFGTSALTTSIGALNGVNTRNFNGKIDDVRVYNYVRTQAQIQQDMRGDSSLNPEISLVGGSANGTATVQPATPIGLWHFDEGYGTTANNAGSGGTTLNGTLTNMASPATSTSGWQNASSGNCKINGCLAFNGSNNYVNLPNIGLSGNVPFSVSMWVNPTSSSNVEELFSFGTSSASNNFELVRNLPSAGNLTIYNINTPRLTVTFPSSGIWHHVVASSNGSNLYMYIDGKLVGTVGYALTVADTNYGIGYSRPQGLYYFTGKIDEVHVYNFAMNQDQINNDYNQGLSLNIGVGAASEASTLTGGAGAAPVGYWNFEEGSGSTVNDRSGNANTGTWNGTLGNQWTNGKIGGGGNFNGTNNYVNVPDSTSLTITGSQITMAAWFKAVNTGTYQRIISKQSATAYYDMIVNSGFDGIYAALTTSGGTVSQNMPYSLVAGNWYYAVITYDGANVKLYMNGTFVSQLPLTGNILTTTGAPLTFGIYQLVPGQWFSGTVDEVKIYNYARSQAQIAYDYNRGAPVGWWKLNECQGTTINDSSGNGYNGTLAVGASGFYTSPGTCGSGTGTEAWNAGTTGKFNSSLGLDGTDDTVNMGNVLNFNYNQPFSVSFWEKTTTSGSMSFIAKQDSNSPYSGWNIQSGGSYIFFQLVNNYGSSSTKVEVSTTNTVNYYDGNWHHFVVTYDGSGLGTGAKIIMDNVVLPIGGTGTSVSGFNTTNVIPLYIGSRNGVAQLYQGLIDEVKVFNYQLTATQIQALYNGGFAVFYGPKTGTP